MKAFLRYEKQILFAPIGVNGQKKLSKSRVGIVGAGALGTHLANTCARSGVGSLIIIDYDKVELSNLQRQILFDESDVGSQKASRAAEKLSAINSEVQIEAFNETLSAANFRDIFKNCDLILDATDNFDTRFVINQLSLSCGIPWIYSGVTASSGQSLLIIPHKTACLRCLIPEGDYPKNFPTVHNSGIISTVVSAIAAITATSAIKYLTGAVAEQNLIYFDVWEQTLKKIYIERNSACPTCSANFKE
ncbi:MAG: HesA/MoeB/ThiF family protein [Erysipelotrichia bacterium]|nr:HesA/MoeB/ThiF family protein [Erysipelotrichia bacterium]